MLPQMLNPNRIEVPDDAVVTVLRRLTPVERLAIANRMWVSARNALLPMLSDDHPEWTDQQVQQEAGRPQDAWSRLNCLLSSHGSAHRWIAL